MKISYDPEIDALYIRLIEGEQECRTIRLNEEIVLNIGPGEKEEGARMEEILGDFPTLREEDVRAVIAFAAASAEDGLPLPAIYLACHEHQT